MVTKKQLLAENIALRAEVERLRALIPDEDPMEEDFALTSDEEEEEEEFTDVSETEDTRPSICPLEIARVKAGLTQVWSAEQWCCPLLDWDAEEHRRKSARTERKPFWDITTKQLSGERKWRYEYGKRSGKEYQYVPGVSQFSKQRGYSRKFHRTAKEKEASVKIMEQRRADPNKYTTTDDIRALAKAGGYAISKSQEATLKEWDKSDWGFQKLMERKYIYAYEYVIHYTKGGGMRVISEQIYTACRTRACAGKDAVGVKRGQQCHDYCQGNIILRKKK